MTYKIEPPIDTTEISLTRLARRAPSKGFDVVLMPGVPFGPEVVLDIRGIGVAGVEPVAEVKTPEDKPEFMELNVEGVVVLMDLYTAEQICTSLRFHEMGQWRDQEEKEN
jgi:hypothetical protein